MLIKEIDAEFCAQDVLEIFSDLPYGFALESSLFDEQRGRFSIVGFDPFDVFVQKGAGELGRLRREFFRYTYKNEHSGLPFYAGIVGFLGYDHGLYQEKIQLRSCDDLGLPDAVFGFYDGAVVIDHLKKKTTVTSSGLPEKAGAPRDARARRRMEMVLARLQSIGSLQPRPQSARFPREPISVPSSNFSPHQYRQAVQKALEHIHAGDIYQVNLSHRFSFKNEGMIDPLALYRLLARRSPSPFSAYFDAGAFKVISSSPERFLHVNQGLVHTRPMKGTRPRGATLADDDDFKRQILESEKEKAELLMITDLERNDLGRVCAYGSVHVRDMRSIESYATVFQATSTVEGRLREDRDIFDLIAAAFPGGSITGCPKIASMQIIEELEPTRRGIYTGSMGYIDFCGNMDLNILIRTLLFRQEAVYFQVGSGIVADSTPEEEYEETLVKARAIKDVLLEAAADPSRQPGLLQAAGSHPSP